MDYIQLSMEEYTQSKREIRENLGGIVKSFVHIGWRLTQIDRSGAYKVDGYQNIADFAKNEYDMTPTGVSRFMSVYETYSAEGDTPELKEQYREFNFSKLTEMLQLEEADRELIRPEAKREDIRELNRFNRENNSGNPDNLLNWNAEPRDLLAETVMEFFRKEKELLNDIYGSEAWQQGNTKELVDMINPSGSRSFRKGTVFLMMYGLEQGVMVKEFGKDMRNLPWEDFFGIMENIFREAAAGPRTYETFFGEPMEPPKAEDPEEPKTQEGPKDQEPELEESEEEPADTPPKSKIAPAQKTEEQKYAEKQAKINRETKARLEEKEDAEKMAHLPSGEEPKTKQLRLPHTYFDDILTGRMPFWLCKNDHYRADDKVDLMEFDSGRHTGRTIHTEVTYVLDDHNALEEGYCILGIKVTGVD